MRLAMKLHISVGDILHLGFSDIRGMAMPRTERRSAKLILIMDPDRDAREICRLALESAGYRVATAESSAQCVRFARALGPDLVVTELFSPGMDGFDLAGALGNWPSTSAIPIVALTTCSIRSYEERALGEGFSGYLKKPLEPRNLIRVIARLLEPASASPAQCARLACTGS